MNILIFNIRYCGSNIDLFDYSIDIQIFFARIQMTHQTKIWFYHIQIFECCWEGDKLIGIQLKKLIKSSNIVYKLFGRVFLTFYTMPNVDQKKFDDILVCFIIRYVSNNNCPTTPFHVAISIGLTQRNSNCHLIESTKNRCSQFDKDEVPAARLILMINERKKSQCRFWWAE